MALGVTTQGPSLRPCISGLRFVSNPMLRMAAASSPNLHRQLSSGESGSWRHESSGESHSGVHHRNSSKLSAKSLVDPRTRKWSVSSKHHLLSGHARGTSISRESFAANCYSRSDGQQRRPIPGPARGQNADTSDDFVFFQHRDPVLMQALSWKLPQEESRSNHNEVFQSQPNGKPGACNRVQNSIKCSTPQKLAVHTQESSAKGNYVTPPSHTYPNRKMGSWGFVDKDSNFQHRMEEKDGVGSRSRITPTHLENFGPKRQVMYNRENPHTSRSQSHLSRDRCPHARFSHQGLYNYAGSAQKNDVGFKADSEAWLVEANNFKAMRGPVEGSEQTHCRNMSSDINPSSRTNEVLSMSNQGRDNTRMSTSAVLNARAPMQKTDNLSVEENVPDELSIATETRGKQVGLPNLGLVSSAQDQGLPCQEILKISSNSQSDSRHNQERKETPETKGKHIGPNNGSDSSINESPSWRNQEKKVTPETNGKPISDDNGVDSAMNEVGTGVTDSKSNNVPEKFNQEKKVTTETNGKPISDDNGVDSAINEVCTGVTDSKSNNVPEKFNHLYNKICIVDNVETAKMVVGKLMGEYKNLIHACDTEVANIDIKKESPVGHGKIICFSIYCGSQADFGNGKSCLWVDVLDRCEDVLPVFAPYFADSSIQKVWHNYSFDKHIIENHGIDVDGFHADTMHLARLWNSDRSKVGGYSLEALTNDPKVMDEAGAENKDDLIKGKESMKSIFGKKKIKKDGTEGKVITLASVQELQTTERVPWICYSALDSISTFSLWKSLKAKLENRKWKFQGGTKGNMYDFYTTYWRPFGDLLAQMESDGMLVDRNYLSEMEKVAVREQEISGSQFREWASTYCSDACYMNVGSDAQVRQLLFGGTCNKKKPTETLPMERTFKVPNVDSFIEEGKKAPLKFRNIVLRGLGKHMEVEAITPSGWPAVSGAALRTLAGKVSVDYDSFLDDNDNELPSDSDEEPAVTSKNVMVKENSVGNEEEIDPSIYGTAYNAFGGGQHGREACQAIGALCEVSSINTLISNFLQPLQGEQISGRDGRVHCSLNINTETGRLSAKRPNLQNQPALEKDRYKIRRAFIAAPGNSLVVADYGQLELRILAHLSDCKSMRDAFKAGGDFHSRTAMNMYPHVREAVEKGKVLLEWNPQPGEEKPTVPLLKDLFATERRKAKMLNFSIAYGKTAIGLSKDWKVSETEAVKTVKLWYNERQEVLKWQEERKRDALEKQYVLTLLGRARHFPNMESARSSVKGHIERAAINTPVQGSAADVAMCAMLEISRNSQLKKLGWKLLLQVHDEVILEGPTVHAEEAKSLVVKCMSYPFNGKNILSVDLAVDAKCALNWYEGK